MILLGDALAKLKEINTDSIDLICTDPPYGYSFMNKDWDKAVVGVDTWSECLRVLKPGAFAFIMSSPRQDVFCKMMLNLIEAGFRTDFSSIYWTYASGFPKAADVSKLVDKRNGIEREVIGEDSIARAKFAAERKKGVSNINMRNRIQAPEFYKTKQGAGYHHPEQVGLITKPATEQAKQLEGAYAGFQPKPAVELILTVMKPLSQKSYVDQALDNQKGITWLDDCRIPYDKHNDEQPRIREGKICDATETNNVYSGEFKPYQHSYFDDKGRFPANLLVEDDVLNDGKNYKSQGITEGYGTLEKGNDNKVYGVGLCSKTPNQPAYKDEGSFSRYFSLDAWSKTYPFLIVPKASKSEKNKGLDLEDEYGYRQNGFSDKLSNRKLAAANNHPTVKPLKLMSYLIIMGSREGDTVLDPFCGSGTTIIAAYQLHRKFIGIEINEEYCNIARKRLEPYLRQSRL